MKALTDYLLKIQDPLLARWRELAERDESFEPASRLSYREFLDDIPYLLSVFSDFIDSGGSPEKLSDTNRLLRRHGRERWKQNFNLEELLRDLGYLNQVTLEAVNRFYEELPAGEQAGREQALLNTSRFFSEVICASAAHFNEIRRSEALEKVDELEQIRRHFEQIGEARQRLLSEAFHDIGGSLTAISGVSEMLKTGEVGDKEEALLEFREILDESVAEAAKVLDAMLQLAHIDAGQVTLETERLHLGEFLRASIDSIAGHREIEVDFDDSSAADFKASVDPEKLRRTIEVLFDLSDANCSNSKTRISCKAEDDHWTLSFRSYADADSTDDEIPMSENRREIDRLLLNRFCLLQNARCEIRENDSSKKEMAVDLEFLSPTENSGRKYP